MSHGRHQMCKKYPQDLHRNRTTFVITWQLPAVCKIAVNVILSLTFNINLQWSAIVTVQKNPFLIKAHHVKFWVLLRLCVFWTSSARWSLNGTFVACLLFAPIFWSNSKNTNSILFGSNDLNTLKHNRIFHYHWHEKLKFNLRRRWVFGNF